MEDVPVRRPARAARLRSVGAGELELQYRVVHGYRRAFRMAGEGPALVLIHGIGDSSATWTDLIPELARTHTVIAPDLLGHGASDKPRADYSVAAYANGVRDLLTTLGIESATLLGHSLGGGVAMQFAYQFPERTERLVLVSAGAPTVAWQIGEQGDDPLRAYLADIFTLPASLAGLPGMSVPAGFGDASSGGLPVGLQLIGNYFDEARLLHVAHALQLATDFHSRTPAGF